MTTNDATCPAPKVGKQMTTNDLLPKSLIDYSLKAFKKAYPCFNSFTAR
jgi:hypothetical protein